jgi:hypothetical protein
MISGLCRACPYTSANTGPRERALPRRSGISARASRAGRPSPTPQPRADLTSGPRPFSPTERGSPSRWRSGGHAAWSRRVAPRSRRVERVSSARFGRYYGSCSRKGPACRLDLSGSGRRHRLPAQPDPHQPAEDRAKDRPQEQSVEDIANDHEAAPFEIALTGRLSCVGLVNSYDAADPATTPPTTRPRRRRPTTSPHGVESFRSVRTGSPLRYQDAHG